MNKRTFVISELMQNNFIEETEQEILLEETEESGKSVLKAQLPNAKKIFCIKNVDKKHTDMYFFKADQRYSMMKRVDHIILEQTENDTWNLHLIEMKSGVGVKKWLDIKGKFRASYLVSQAIAAMLEISLEHTYLYTTFEKECFDACSETMPVERRARTGNIPPKREWESGRVELNFGEKISFDHEKVQMNRSTDGLKGNVQMK